VQGQVAAADLPVCLLTGNRWQQGKIALTNLQLFFLFFFFFFPLSLNFLLPGLIKLKQNTENGRDMQASGRLDLP
jgi:hypothetical protein